jgi:polysaccharide export outer membrane protein
MAPAPKTTSIAAARDSRRSKTAMIFRIRFVLTTAALAFAVACGSSGPYVWYHDLPRTEWEASFGEYVIGVGDGISVGVYGQEALATHAKVRTDGRIALPLAGEVVAAGKHPSALAREIEARVAQYIQQPHVTVNVDDVQPVVVSFIGEVGHVGSLTLDRASTTLLQGLAQAGGPTDYADRSRIFVLRKAPEFRRIRFTYDSLVENRGGAALFPLRTGDVIVVE